MNNIIKTIVLIVYRIFTMVFPVNKNKIVFESNLGRNYSGNPKAIYEELVAQGLDEKYSCYWIMEDIQTKIPGKAKVIKRSRTKYFYIMATAGIWISDSRHPKHIIKREKCTYIQTWHGTPLKKLALDMDDVFMAGETNIEDYKKNFKDNTSTWDYLISQNNYSTEIFKRAFDFHRSILETGYPRNDLLFKGNNEEYIRKVKEELKLPLDKKVILYAPTWRDNEFYGKGQYKFNPAIDFDRLQKELSKDYVLIVKYHYLVMDQIDWSSYAGFIYDFDLSQDISDLYLVSDILITDYSSVMFDYSLLKRPMIFYCYDLIEYKDKLRGFYFDFVKEAPGEIVEDMDGLSSLLKEFDDYQYLEAHKENYNKFSDKYNYLDKGNASKEVVSLIIREARK